MQFDADEILTEMEELEEEANHETTGDTNNTVTTNCCLSGFDVEEDTIVSSKFATLYKVTKTPMTQQERREKLLEELKERRHQSVAQRRGTIEFLNILNNKDGNENGEIAERDSQLEPMDVLTNSRPRKRSGKNKSKYCNKLMMSEWFTEIPSDLESNWLVKVCPVGVRNLVVANRGITKAYNKSGALLARFSAELPGGNLSQVSSAFTILDCIYHQTSKSYFVLDVIAWKNLEICNTADRFLWLNWKFDERPELKEVTPSNKYRFFEIKAFPAEMPLIQEKLSCPYKINNEILPVDGVLFYHQATHYIQSITPLVGWLKPYMIPEMLHIPVSEYFMKGMPENYTSFQEFLKHRPKRSKKKLRVCSDKMEV